MQRVKGLALVLSFALACSSSPAPTNAGAGGEGPGEDKPDASMRSPDTRPKDTQAPAEPDGPPAAVDLGPPREEILPEHPATLPTPVAGTRLKMMISQPVDGPEVLRNWFDDLRKEPCGFQWASDGVLRCLPLDSVGTFEPAFADATCTTPAIVRTMSSSTCPGTPLLYVTTTRPSCPQMAVVAPLGEKLAVPTVYHRSGGACVPRGAPLSATQEAHAIGAEVPPAMFVAGKLSVGDAKGGRLAPVFVEGEDGSRAFRNWRDTTTGTDCYAGLATDGTVRCLPSSLAIDGFVRSDAACMVQAITSPKSTCADADQRVVAQQISSQCPSRVQVSRLSGKVAGAFTSTGGQCSAAPVNDALDVWGVASSAVDPAIYAPLDFGVTGGNTRLRARTEQTAAGAVMFAAYWDAKLHTRCSSTVAADGVIRCLPNRLAAPIYFEDPACAGTPGLVFVSTGECLFGYVGKIESTCPPRGRVYALGAPYFGATYRVDAQRGCIKVTANTGFQPYRVGAELPPTDFVEVRRP